jgi:hypothetical protein
VLRVANIPRLSQLFLGANKIGGEGFKSLVNANWPNLTELDIGRHSII